MTSMTTPTTTPATTESSRSNYPRFHRRLAQIPVRTRITAVLALLTAAGLASAGILVYALESSRLERDVTAQIEQEQAEFEKLVEDRNDSESDRALVDIEALLRTFLERNVPDEDEMLVAYAGGRPRERTLHVNGQGVLREPAVAAAIDDVADSGGTKKIDAGEFGEVWLAALPVRMETGGDSGALIGVHFIDSEYAELNRTMQTYAAMALLSLGIITALAAWQSAQLLAPLRVLRETAEEISATDLSQRLPETGNDDITALTRTVNGMLARLEAAFADQRLFLDAAGHELRTPLTVLSGHLELADLENPEELYETKELLLEEIDRMSRLVNDLMMLAKARRPDFLALAPSDLDRLTRALLAKGRGLGERGWQLDGTGDGAVVLDTQRITQAVLQLVDNAVKHTDPGDVIAVGSAVTDVGCRIWVRDSGDGVPEADRQRIFERFGRSRSRAGDEGFGLGLSIVAAIAERHGGSVDVSDAPGGGSVFAISLPDGGRQWLGS
ncbi:MAG: sensor histidine kinase [Nocardioides sp.]